MNPASCPCPVSQRPAAALRTSGELPRRRWQLVSFLAIGAATLLLPSTAQAGAGDETVAVYSSVNPAYARRVLEDGSVKPETYAFGEGGVQGGTINDESFDRIRFADVARAIAPSLALKKYQPCNPADPKRTDLLIVVYWGTTIGSDARSASAAQYDSNRTPSSALSPLAGSLGGASTRGSCADGTRDPAKSGRNGEGQIAAALKAADDSAAAQSALLASMANRQRDRQDAAHAAILGYLPELKRVESYRTTALRQRRQDVVDEIEESRYYVVLKAYDFPSLLQRKEKKLLWETRFSIRQNHNDFSRQLTDMARSASHCFGQNTGLVRRPLTTTRIELGELTSMGPEG